MDDDSLVMKPADSQKRWRFVEVAMKKHVAIDPHC